MRLLHKLTVGPEPQSCSPLRRLFHSLDVLSWELMGMQFCKNVGFLLFRVDGVRENKERTITDVHHLLRIEDSTQHFYRFYLCYVTLPNPERCRCGHGLSQQRNQLTCITWQGSLILKLFYHFKLHEWCHWLKIVFWSHVPAEVNIPSEVYCPVWRDLWNEMTATTPGL